MSGHDTVELGERIDLLHDYTAHLRRALRGLLRQLEDALAQLAASCLHFARHRSAHLAHLAHDLDEALAGLAEQRRSLTSRLLIDRM